MSKRPANNIRVYLDQYDLSADLNSSVMNLVQETAPVAGLSTAGPRRVVGNYDHDDAFLGFFESTDDLYDEIIHALVGNASDHYLTTAYESASENTIAYSRLINLTDKPLSGQTGGAALLNFNANGRGGISRDLVLASATVTGAGNRTGRNMGTTSSGTTLRAMFRILSFSGTNITLNVQESSDDGSGDAYATISGMTSGAQTGVAVVVTTTTAATEAWKRVNITGTFTSALILVTLGTVA